MTPTATATLPVDWDREDWGGHTYVGATVDDGKHNDDADQEAPAGHGCG